jgi:methionyl-tRNA formyltransferase
LNSKEYEVAKLMIRAFDSIGPAFIKYNDKFYKIHKFTNNPNGFPIELNGGILYPLVITPEGKKKMQVEDYIRGNK